MRTLVGSLRATSIFFGPAGALVSSLTWRLASASESSAQPELAPASAQTRLTAARISLLSWSSGLLVRVMRTTEAVELATCRSAALAGAAAMAQTARAATLTSLIKQILLLL